MSTVLTAAPETTRRIVLWGPAGCGKSSYLSTLVFFHRQEQGERRLCVLPANAVTAEWVALRVQGMRGTGTSDVAKTRDYQELTFRLYDLPARAALPFPTRPFGDASQPSRVLGELSVWDVQGELYRDDPPAPLLDAMLDASGLVLLIDPGQVPRAKATAYYTSFFQATLGALSLRLRSAAAELPDPRIDARNKLRIPVAICLTKSDQHADLQTDADRREQFRAIVGEAAGLLESWVTTHAVYAISALGHATEQRDGRAVLVREPEPWNALLPLRWVLDQAPRGAHRPTPALGHAATPATGATR
jgi:GTPase SAR1 family protein